MRSVSANTLFLPASLGHHIACAEGGQQGDAAAEGSGLVVVLVVDGQHGRVVTGALRAVAGQRHLGGRAVGVGATVEQATLRERRHAQTEDDCDCH